MSSPVWEQKDGAAEEPAAGWQAWVTSAGFPGIGTAPSSFPKKSVNLLTVDRRNGDTRRLSAVINEETVIIAWARLVAVNNRQVLGNFEG